MNTIKTFESFVNEKDNMNTTQVNEATSLDKKFVKKWEQDCTFLQGKMDEFKSKIDSSEMGYKMANGAYNHLASVKDIPGQWVGHELNEDKVNENPMVAMAVADKLKEAYDAMKEQALEVDSDGSENTAMTEMCEMMKENAAMIGMATKELAEMMKEVHVPGHEETSETMDKEMDENPAVAMAAADMLSEMMETFDASMSQTIEMLKKEGAKEDIAAELISKELSK